VHLAVRSGRGASSYALFAPSPVDLDEDWVGNNAHDKCRYAAYAQ
jgi:hypothetical protein